MTSTSTEADMSAARAAAFAFDEGFVTAGFERLR
jgi:hypothetical protein